MHNDDRIIGQFNGHEDGPLIIAIGSIHGNEPAGIKAIKIMLKMLEVEPLANPNFKYKGKFIGLIGNMKAVEADKRFLEVDMNRSFTEEKVTRILASSPEELENEDEEIYELIHHIRKAITESSAQKVCILDLHTTTAGGGIFTLPQETEESLEIALQLHAPVILEFLTNIRGTSLQYFTTEHLGVDTTAVTFEAGQHHDRLSVHRAVSAIAGFMRSVDAVKEKDVESHHDELLRKYAEGLPKLAELIHSHPIEPEDHFKMEPGFHNFDPIEKGQLIATDKNGEIRAPESGMILMPLYQSQGEDGYFIVKKVSTEE